MDPHQTLQNTTEPEQLARLRAALAAFTVRSCRIAHERVQMHDAQVVRRVSGADQLPVRVGLCDWTERAHQLSCAHTTARYRLADVITDLARLDLLSAGEAARLQQQVVQFADTIHAADWAKGEVEVAYATAIEQRDEPGHRRMETELQRLESTHSSASSELETVLQRLVEVADRQHALSGRATHSF